MLAGRQVVFRQKRIPESGELYLEPRENATRTAHGTFRLLE